MTLHLSTFADPAALTKQVRAGIAGIHPELPVFDVGTMRQHVNSRALLMPRMAAFVVGISATVGLTLALLGLYAVVAHFAVLRTREIAIRIAVGAQRGQIFRGIVNRGLKLSVLGAALGIVPAVGVAKVVATSLQATAGITFALITAIGIVMCVTVAASLSPGLRASRVDPATVLRSE